LNEKIKQLIPYAIVLLSFSVTIFIIVIILDLALLPSLIHNREVVKVPDVVGRDVKDAINLMEDAGLVVAKINELSSDKVPQGYVISQIPRANMEVKKERSVYLTVSKGQETVEAPYLVGMPLRTARVNLTNKGLSVGNVEYVFNDTYGVDTVISQSVSYPNKVSYGSSINLIVSKGPENLVKVPNFIGSNYDEAVKIINEIGLSVGNISFEKHHTYIENTVINQKPEPGSTLKKLDKIDLIISK
jgi:serine/threonine-protein kinase